MIIEAIEYDRVNGRYREVEVKKCRSWCLWEESEGMKRESWKGFFPGKASRSRYNRLLNKYDVPKGGCFLFLPGDDQPYYNADGTDHKNPIFPDKRGRIFFPAREFDAAKCLWETLFDPETNSWKRGGISKERYKISMCTSRLILSRKDGGSEVFDPLYLMETPDKYIAWAPFLPAEGVYSCMGKPIEIQHIEEVEMYERSYANERFHSQNSEN